MSNIFLISQTFSQLSGSMSGIFFIKGAPRSTNFRTKICLILVIFMLSKRSSLYMTGPRTLKILKSFNLIKSNLLLGRVVWINIIFMFDIFCRKYTLFLSLRVSPRTFFLSVNSFIFLLRKIKFYQSFSYNLQISFTITTIYNTRSSHFLISIKTSASNLLFIKNGVLLVILCSDVLYASIPMGNNLTQLVCQQSQNILDTAPTSGSYARFVHPSISGILQTTNI